METNVTRLSPLKAVTDTDQGGVLAIATAMGLVFALLSLLIRAYVRVECKAAFSKDDAASCLSVAVTVIQSAVVFVAVHDGYGRTTTELSTDANAKWQRDLYISDAFYLIGMWLSKVSIVLLLLRLSRDSTHKRTSQVLLVVVTVFSTVSLLATMIRCDAAHPWQIPGGRGCSKSTFARWSAVTAMDALSEVALFAGGVWLVRDLQLSWRHKSAVVFAYGLRLPVIAAAGVRLHYLPGLLYSSDPSLKGIPSSVCTQVELGYAVAATTMPCLRPFMAALNTQYGGGPACIYVNQSVVTALYSGSRGTGGYASQLSSAPHTKTRGSTESDAVPAKESGAAL